MKTKNVIIAGLFMCLGISIGGSVVFAAVSNVDWVLVNTTGTPSETTDKTELSTNKIDMTNSADVIELRSGNDTFRMDAGTDQILMGDGLDALSMGAGADIITFAGTGSDINHLIFQSSAAVPISTTTGTWLKHDNSTDDLEIRVSEGKLVIRLGD